MRCRSSVSCSWLLRAVSSSLSDCNSSFEVSSSSFVDWIFLVDGQRFFVDRLLLFARDLEVADGALQFRSRGFEFLLELGDPRQRPRGVVGRPRSALVLRLVDEADQQQLLALAQNRLDGDAERDRVAVVVHPAAGDDNARILLTGLLDRRPELGAHALTRHGEQIVGGMPRRHAQIAVGRPRE